MQRILIVADEGSLRPLVRQALEGWGYFVEEAASGQETVEAFKRERVDLVIVDLQMRDQAGMDTIVVIRELSEDLPIIAVSGSLEVALDLGANIQIEKPFGLVEVLTAIRWLLDGPRV